MVILVTILGVLAAVDITTSLWGLTHGYPEAAPAMAAVVAHLGVWAVAPLKVILAIIIVALISRVTTRSRVIPWTLALALFAVPAVANLSLLIQGR